MKSTKRSLILSVFSMLLCITMLLGTTYAWFTDTVTSGKNKIIAGNLDVELVHSNASVTDQPVQDATDLFGVELWEPGVVAYENFTVSNVGNLALKYALSLNVFDKNATENGNDLTEVIKVAVVEDGFSGDREDAKALEFTTLATFQKTGSLEAGAADDVFGVVLYWEPTDNDNLYNLKNGLTSTDGEPLFVEFGVTVVATQDTVEADSFDELYDINAELPVVASFPNISKADVSDATKSLKIDKQGALESAEVPATGAKTIFETLEDTTDGYTNDMTLTLSVNETNSEEKEIEGGTEKTINLDINMSAVMKVTDSATGALVETKKEDNVENLDEFTTIKLKIGKFTSVSVLHKGEPMEELASASATPTDEVNGGFYYDGEDYVYLVTKTFSPFEFKCVNSKAKLYYTTVKYNDDDVKVVTFAGIEWIVIEEKDGTALMLAKDNVGAEYFSSNNSALYKDSVYDKAMLAYYDSLSDDDKAILAAETFKESVLMCSRSDPTSPAIYLEAGDPLIDQYNTELELQGVELLNGSNTYDIERYVFALSYEQANAFGAAKLASVAKDGILDYSDVGDYGDTAFFLRTANTYRSGFVCDVESDGSISYGGASYFTFGVRPAVRIDLNKASLAEQAK